MDATKRFQYSSISTETKKIQTLLRDNAAKRTCAKRQQENDRLFCEHKGCVNSSFVCMLSVLRRANFCTGQLKGNISNKEHQKTKRNYPRNGTNTEKTVPARLRCKNHHAKNKVLRRQVHKETWITFSSMNLAQETIQGTIFNSWQGAIQITAKNFGRR